MKFIVEIEIREDHPILHRKHIDGEAKIKDTIERQLAVLNAAKVTVKKVAKAAPKKK